MELTSALRGRKMVRSFTHQALPESELLDVLDLARRAPSAGNSQGVGFVLLHGADEVARYWNITMPVERRSGFRWQGLLKAPALVLITVSPDEYVRRYGEQDKASTGLGQAAESWPVPYWWVDAGAVAQNLLLLAVDRGWGACLFGPFDHEPALAKTFALPDDRRIAATIALGIPRPEADEPGRSAARPRRPINEITVRPTNID